SDCGASFQISGTHGHGYNALQVYEVTGETHPGLNSDLYFGTMDNNLWASADSGATWPGVVAFEGFFIQVPHSSPISGGQKVTFVACGACGQLLTGPVFGGPRLGWPQPLAAITGNPVVVEEGVYVQWAMPSPPASQLYLTTNTGGTWTAVSGATTALSRSGLQKVAGPAASPTVYQGVLRPVLSPAVRAGGGPNKVGLVKITGVRTASATVTDADGGLSNVGTYCNGQGTFVCPTVFGVDPGNPNHLIAPDADTQQMKVSTDGGASWTVDAMLTSLVTNGGQLLFNVPNVGVQAHSIFFDPNNGNHIFVGTDQNGIIASLNGGLTWVKLPGSDRIPVITSFFFDEVQNDILVSSYGRGLWKLSLAHVPPQSSLSIGSPRYPPGSSQPFVTSATPFTVSALDGTSGVGSVSYRFFRQGAAPPAYTTVAGSTTTFHVTGSDGTYEVDFFSTNNVGDDETAHSQLVKLDNTAPVTTIVQPSATPYPHSATLTLNYTVSDGTGSGVASFTPTLDGATTLAGHGLASGQAIDLLTEMTLGSHTFRVVATDNLGNTGTTSVTFTVIATPHSLVDDVTQFFALGKIKNRGLEQSLLAKLDAASDALDRGTCNAARNLYQAFINELMAQSGKGIDATAAATMIADAEFVIAHLPCA
ncbi:MAG TPA: hypothetical protein VK131_10820, partial [Candidatus Acidoferrales bacterium]|nr:hypothetical protein [Candidatus Acidoferrales bacterium]